MGFFGRTWLLVKMTSKELGRHAVHRMAGALAFFALFGIPPLALIVLTIAGWILGDDTAREGLLAQVEASLGAESRDTLDGIIRNTPRPGEGNFATQLFSLGALLFGATLTFYQLQAIMNDVWASPNRKGWLRFLAVVFKRFLSFMMLAATGLLVVLWISASTLLKTFPEDLQEFLPADVVAFVTSGLEGIFAFLLLAMHFALTYKILPDVRVPIRSAIVAAIVAALLFAGGRELVEIYLNHRTFDTAFGAAGSLVVTLVWIYAASLITLIGAVFSKTYTRWRELTTAVLKPSSN